MRASILFALLLSTLVACASDDPATEPPGRGSAACRDAQDALCDFGSDRCHVIDRASCDSNFRGIECRSDEAASTCANALNAAACGQLVVGCDLATLADPAPAIERCEQLLEAICDHAMQCGATPADCMQGTSIDCDGAIAIDLRYEECLETIATLACTAPIPTICQSVVLVLPPEGSL